MTKRKERLLKRILAIKDSFMEHLWKTTTAFGYSQNTMSEEECRLMDDIIELESEINELK